MEQFWLVVGSENNWNVAFKNGNLWGLKDMRELRSLWNMLREADRLLFYASRPVHGIVGFGQVVTKFRQTNPLWPDEIERNEVIWPLRFEFNVEYCLPPSLWKSNRYSSHDLQMITRMVFQCYPAAEVNNVRRFLGLTPIAEHVAPSPTTYGVSSEVGTINHDELKACLAEIGLIQGYIAEKEYPMDSMRLDVVWRRVERSVPTFVFEVQIAGDIFQAMAKLKHAFDLWNSKVFLVAGMQDKSKFDELISGTFHEAASQMQFIDVRSVTELLRKKRDYKQMERDLGIIRA